MTKAFFDAFPTIATDDEELSSLLEHTTVTRVCVSEKSSQLKIYLDADRLIPKRQIEKIEKNFDDEFAAGQGLSTRIIEHFHLSGQYTPKNLMRVYRSSILHELQGFQQWMYTMFRGADIRFSDDETCVIEVEDRLIFRSHADELKRILDKIFTERFGLNFKCTVHFRENPSADNSACLPEAPLPENAALQESGQGDAPRQSGQGDASRQSGQGDAPRQSGQGDALRQSGQDAPGASSKGRRRYSKRGTRQGTERELIQSSNPDVVYGRDFADESVPIASITDAVGTVTIRCQVLSLETRDIHTKAGKDLTIAVMIVTDFTDTISVKLFLDASQAPEFLEKVKKDMFLKIRGSASIDRFDSDLAIASVSGMKKIADFRPHRFDNAPVKRVELHCHTKMSKMDAVCDVGAIVKTAIGWGHSAIAITDHGGVQALPDAWHAVPKDSDFKVIYGCEAYLVDDEVRAVGNGKKGQMFSGTFVVFDLETTGFSPVSDRIIEIGAVKITDGKITDRFSEFVNPQRPIPFRIEQLTSINDSMVMDADPIEKVLVRFLEFCADAPMVGHNVTFDISFIEENCERMEIAHDFTTVDTMTLARSLLPNLARFRLDQVAKALNVPLGQHHRAVDDAECTAGIFLKFLSMLSDQGLEALDQINETCAPTQE